MTKKKKTCREKHKIIRMRKVTIPGKRKGEKKYKKKRKRKIIQQQLYILIRRGSHNQGRKKQI